MRDCERHTTDDDTREHRRNTLEALEIDPDESLQFKVLMHVKNRPVDVGERETFWVPVARLLEAKGMAGSQLMSMVKEHHARIEAAVQAAVDAHAEHQEAVGEGEGTAA